MALYLFFLVCSSLIAWPFFSHTYLDFKLKWISPNQISFGGSRASRYGLYLNKGGMITPKVATFIKNTLAQEHITGLSVAVVPNTGKPEFHVWGNRSEDGDEMTPDTLFHIASLSKAFCATAVGLLIDDFANGRNMTTLPPGLNELTWRTRLKDLIPGWRLMDEWASERANLHDILSHVSGLPRHEFSYAASDTPWDILQRLKYLKPAFELREQYLYNNLMFMIAMHVVTTFAGQPYTSFVEERIFVPLRMTSTTFSPAKAKASGMFTQGWTKRGRRIPKWFTEDMATLISGAGGIISNSIDMSKWISTWLNEGVYDNQNIIPLSVYQNMTYAYTISADHPSSPGDSISGYGMGWDRTSSLGHDIVLHEGAMPGFSTLLAFLPNDGFGISIFANVDGQGEPNKAILKRILHAAFGLSEKTSVMHTQFPTLPKHNDKDTYKASAHNITSHLDAMAGTYTNPGYGTLVLCGPSSPSLYCARVRSEFAAVDQAGHEDTPEGSNRAASVDLFAAWPRFWTSHVWMYYLEPSSRSGSVLEREYGSEAEGHVRRSDDGLRFGVFFTALFPRGYGKDRSPFKLDDIWDRAGTAEFQIEEGVVLGFELLDSTSLTAAWFERVRD